MTYEDTLRILSEFAGLRESIRAKAVYYRVKDDPELRMRFENAVHYATNAHTMMLGALMAEREAEAAKATGLTDQQPRA